MTILKSLLKDITVRHPVFTRNVTLKTSFKTVECDMRSKKYSYTHITEFLQTDLLE